VVFKKMLRAFGVGGPKVDTVLSTLTTYPGQAVSGQVNVQGGDHEVTIEHITLGLVTRVEVETQDSEYDTTVEFHRQQVASGFHLPAGQGMSIPFSFPIPWETPVTRVFGQPLHGMTMGVRTELAVAKALDKGDLDPLAVEPLPSQVVLLDAVSRLGFRFKGADLERGRIRGAQQTLPFYQEIEFHAGPEYSRAMNELELTMVTNPNGIEVILEGDKRGGIVTSGRDVFHHFQVPHNGAENTDWAAVIDSWLRQSVLNRSWL
jgi:sporulation-control protein